MRVILTIVSIVIVPRYRAVHPTMNHSARHSALFLIPLIGLQTQSLSFPHNLTGSSSSSHLQSYTLTRKPRPPFLLQFCNMIFLRYHCTPVSRWLFRLSIHMIIYNDENVIVNTLIFFRYQRTARSPSIWDADASNKY